MNDFANDFDAQNDARDDFEGRALHAVCMAAHDLRTIGYSEAAIAALVAQAFAPERETVELPLSTEPAPF